MSADSIYSDDWNSCLTESQINSWNLEDDITRIGSKAEDFLSGILGSERCVSETTSRWKAHSNQDSSDPFRRFQTPPPPDRKSPTPLADLYSQSIYQAEVDSDSWQTSENCNRTLPADALPADEEENSSPNEKEVECMPQDLFSFTQQEPEKAADSSDPKTPTAESSLETLNRSLTEPQDNAIVEETAPSPAEDAKSDYTPTLIVDTAKEESDRSAKRPLLSLSIGISICGVGLVFGAQIMHNAAVVNPGKSLIIAGLIGMFVSVALQTFNWLGKRRTV